MAGTATIMPATIMPATIMTITTRITTTRVTTTRVTTTRVTTTQVTTTRITMTLAASARNLVSCVEALPPGARTAFYPGGYHLLMRDKERAVVIADVIAWIEDPEAPLPSGAEQAAAAWLAGQK